MSTEFYQDLVEDWRVKLAARCSGIEAGKVWK
jgi:hypothetical protein